MDFLEFWLFNKAKLDERINRFIDSIKDWEVLEMSKYILKDGKRYRGVLLLYFNQILGGDPEQAYDASVAVEILHSASLALDDIVDYDLYRRGEKAAWAVFTNRKVIYVTNFLIPTALNMISRYGKKALDLSINLWRDTAIGALKDTYGSFDEYISTVEMKTGSLFKLSTMLAAFTSNRDNLYEAMLDVGKDLGIIYQLVDDYVDYVKYMLGSLQNLSGSALQLYNLARDDVRSYVIKNIEIYKTEYLNILNKIDITEKYLPDLKSIPDVLIAGLLKESGIDKI
ncbi:MAG: hexaprenyl pyrophosphate synthase [Sulfolobaceae archaeon]|nr:hexaprenyl pyrophosphate synthase [Sulfolobaceae archaeon]